MTTRLHVGAGALRGGLEAYAKRFNMLEVSRAGAAPPTFATLRKWRKAVSPSFEFVVVAGPQVSSLKPSESLDAEIEDTIETINALEARCILIRTPLDVTPSAIWRERMNTVLKKLPRDATQVAWQPRGVWEVEAAAVAARRWEIVLCVDASREPVPPGPTAYIRLPAIGETRSYGSAALERVLERVGERRDAYVIFETASALAEAKLLRTLAAKQTTNASARIAKPRAAPLRVRDDEQE